MALRLLDNGRIFVCSLVKNQSVASLQVELFQGNITPTQNDTNATYASSLCNFTGYAPVAITGWTGPLPTGVLEQITGNSCLFQVTAPASVSNQVYGYLVRDAITGNILWAERFANPPLSMTNIGDNIVVIPVYTEQSQFA